MVGIEICIMIAGYWLELLVIATISCWLVAIAPFESYHLPRILLATLVAFPYHWPPFQIISIPAIGWLLDKTHQDQPIGIKQHQPRFTINHQATSLLTTMNHQQFSISIIKNYVLSRITQEYDSIKYDCYVWSLSSSTVVSHESWFIIIDTHYFNH